jgi:ATP-dependent protease ClpP protease subunit
MNPQEALDFGLIDEVISDRASVEKIIQGKK